MKIESKSYENFELLAVFKVHGAQGIFNLPISNQAAESTAENFQIFIKHDILAKVWCFF